MTDMKLTLSDAGATDRASRLASGVSQLFASESAGYEDIRRFGAPSECGALVSRHIRQGMTDLLIKFEIGSVDEYNELVLSRVDGRWAYMNHLLLNDDDVYETELTKIHCPQCGGVGEYRTVCNECEGEGCDFCDFDGHVWLPCYKH